MGPVQQDAPTFGRPGIVSAPIVLQRSPVGKVLAVFNPETERLTEFQLCQQLLYLLESRMKTKVVADIQDSLLMRGEIGQLTRRRKFMRNRFLEENV